MRIIAVIPARGGSKGIPNKNIRLVNGRPLICYQIENAKKSKYITDIVISSDSPEIELIAKVYGVNYRKRSDSLCKDETTLDAVVYDAVKEFECETVITMQPTSPTLKVDTLDKAIEYFLCNDLDTLISVVNSPRLSWHNVDGIISPVYKKRLNRQYMPAEYVETGAFVISKHIVISESTRIGKKVDIYEIPAEEAIDIDDFSDLAYAEQILNKKKIAIYVNGNNIRGMGHVYRSLELADEFYSKPDIFYNIDQTDKAMFGNTTHNLIAIKSEQELFEYVKREKYNILINDVLETSLTYMETLKKISPEMKVINFEDDGEGMYKADLVINALYQNEQCMQMKSGYRYYIAPKLFLLYSPIMIKEKVEKVFISFGGSDPQNYTQRLLNIITREKYNKYEFIIVIGRAYEEVQKIMEYNKYPNIDVCYDVKNMPEVMSMCDIAVTSRGRTGYELALLGIPTISMAQNEREEKHGFVSAEHGFNYLGLNPTDSIIDMNLMMYISMDKHDRMELSKKLSSNDLRNGRKRVLALIDSL